MVLLTRGLLERELRDAGFVIAAPDGPPELPVAVLGRTRRHLTAGPIEIDLRARVVTVAGRSAALSQKEYALLVRLASDPDRVFTREELLAEVWGYEVASGGRTVDSHVRAVRHKLGNDLIRTVHGVGYALDETGMP
jgi:DNA-binding response OmpR family regulator